MGVLGIIAKKAPGGIMKLVKKLGKKIVKKKGKQAAIKGAIQVNKSLAKAAAYNASPAVRGINPNAIIPMPTIVKNVKPVAKKAVKTLNQKIVTGLKVLGGLTTVGGIAGLIGKKKKKKKKEINIYLVNGSIRNNC